MPSITTENYLKAIYQLWEKHPEAHLVRLGEIAQELEVTAGTITTMIKRLAEKGLVEYHRRSGVRLTPEGLRQALQVVRRHRLVEYFLVNALHMDWSEVHEDAEALEHAVSDRVLDRIDAMMGFPERDPHGDPIPGNDGRVPSAKPIPLHQTVKGTLYEVSRIEDQEARILESVAELALKPGRRFSRLSDPESGNSISLEMNHQNVSVPVVLASCILVRAVS